MCNARLPEKEAGRFFIRRYLYVKNFFYIWLEHFTFILQPTTMKFSSLLALSVVFTSCKKDKDDAAKPSQKSKTELLTNKNWRLTRLTDQASASSPVINIYDSLEVCERNELIRFETSGASKTYRTQSGCFGPTNGEWKFDLTESELQMGQVMSPTWTSWNVPEKIKSLTETTLVLENEDISYSRISTYTVQ